MITQTNAQILIEINNNDIKSIYVKAGDFPFKRIPVAPLEALKLSDILKTITAHGAGTLRSRFSENITGLGPLEIK